jgi:hypothetical protein
MPYRTAKDDPQDEDPDASVDAKKHPTDPMSIVHRVTASGGSHSDLALSLFLSGVLSRPDLTILLPSTESLPLERDPVGACPPATPHRARPPCDRTPDAVPPSTGASISDEFALNRRFVCYEAAAAPPRPARDVDAALSRDHSEAAERSLSDCELEAAVTSTALIALAHGRLHFGLPSALAGVYGPLAADLLVYVKMAASPPAPVTAALRRALVAHACRHYRLLRLSHAALCECALRVFPCPRRIDGALAALAGGNGALCARVRALLADWERRVDRPFPMAYRDLVLLTRFCVFYKRYVRATAPSSCIAPRNCFAGASRDWEAIHGEAIRRACGSTPFP